MPYLNNSYGISINPIIFSPFIANNDNLSFTNPLPPGEVLWVEDATLLQMTTEDGSKPYVFVT